jgi:hypothetical protein
MKGPRSFPSVAALKKMYILLGKPQLDIKTLFEIYPLTRFDPRLAEILVLSLARNWQRFNPLSLNQKLRGAMTPAVLGLLLEQAEFLIEKKNKGLFRAWRQMTLMGIKPSRGEIFWIGVYGFNSETTRNLPFHSTKPFLKWGFYGDDVLINKAQTLVHTKTTISKPNRLKILAELAKEKKTFSVNDYLKACRGLIQRRTAENDLAKADFLVSKGFTRRKTYGLATSSFE